MDEQLRSKANDFLRYLSESLDITETQFNDATERYGAVTRYLERPESAVTKLHPRIYTQGSFRLGTIVKLISDKDEYDLDLVCKVDLGKDQISQKQLKELIGREIKGYAIANNMNSPAVESRRCWRLAYAASATFHMDILPAIPDNGLFRKSMLELGVQPGWLNQVIAITDNKHPQYAVISPDWLNSNPEGYAEWFKERMKVQFEENRRKEMVKLAVANAEAVPEFKVKTTLQRAIQILKRHRDLMFADTPEDKPISIIITTLAAQAYNNEPNLYDALVNIVNNMECHIRMLSNGVYLVPNPVNPNENFADKWSEDGGRRAKTFYEWINKTKADITHMISDLSIINKGALVAVFGADIVGKAIDKLSQGPGTGTTIVAPTHVKITNPNKPWSPNA